MFCLSSRRSLLSRGLRLHLSACSALMYASRLYNAPAAGAGGGSARGAVKQGRRSLTMIEAPPLSPLTHPQHSAPPTSAYHLYQGRPLDTQRSAHFHYHGHLGPPHLPPQYQHQVHFHSYGGGAAGGVSVATTSKKKAWNFIHEKMSYDTFFTMKRLIERSRKPDEVLRWVTQNPAKISHNHYPVALQKIGQLLQASPSVRPEREDSEAGGKVKVSVEHNILEHQDFQTLCDAIINNCSKLDNFSIVNCLYAVATLGLPSDSQLVQVLERECQSRLNQFNQKDVSMVFSSSMKLHPGVQHPLTEACLACLEKNLERERHPQTLFMLLSYYRLKWHSLKHQEPATGGSDAPPNPEQLLANRKILRLVKHTLASISGVRDQEMALLDEMLATCAREASNKSLELIFSSHLFYQNRQEKFICSLAEELPKKSDGISPYTMALIAKYIARHRLRETRLLDTIADFLVKKAEFLDSKVIQKLVFPFSRMSYRPSNEQQFFTRLEEVLELKALSSPLATVNILMSLFQLGHFPGAVLHRVFSSTFISNVTNGPYALIVRRYLSLLDAAVGLENQNYTGPRLQNNHKVLMFDHALTADEVNRKYSYKGLVAEALRQLVGEENYKQDQVLAPGYYTDFLLWLDTSNRVLPISSGNVVPSSTPADGTVAVLTSEFRHFSPFAEDEHRRLCPVGESVGGAIEPLTFLPHHICSATVPSGSSRSGTNGTQLEYGQYYMPATQYYPSLAKEHSLESQDSSTLSSPPSEGLAPPPSPGTGATKAPDSLLQFSIGKILEDEGHSGAKEMGGPDCALPGFYETVACPEGSSVDRGTESPKVQPPEPPEPDPVPLDQRAVRKVVVSVNDKWHYCHNSDVLVGSRAMRDRHLRLLGYIVLQLPYQDLEKLNGIEEVKSYLQEKLVEVTALR